MTAPGPPHAFLPSTPPRTPLRAAITAAYRRPEPACLPPLLEAATLPPAAAHEAQTLARTLVTVLRRNPKRGGVEGLIQEYDLTTHEGVALMCLAEALLRIPDPATRDALIRDKIAPGDWRAHIGHSPSVFVNAATWGLVVTGRLAASTAPFTSETALSSSLTRLIARGGEPLIRRGVDMAMRMMGEQFVTGQTIQEALRRSRRMQARGFRYSYDMLGEAAATAEDAARYLHDYETAIQAIGAAAHGPTVLDRPGISIKLSALHPRYTRAKRERVLAELLPRLLHLAHAARRHDIGLNIDAEEADRLELSLDLLEALCTDPALETWAGIGFVVQAYQKRAPFVLDWLIDLARRTRHRLMIRLVKGAYWDSEIKRAQLDGLDGFPVFTRKLHTDVSYLACARRLLDAPDAVFPQFATHNAQTLAAIVAMAPAPFHPGQYEFQCLHGMGEPLYDEVVGPERLGRPCRIYAPVGTHETLLAYLVRRLLENGANSSFVNRIADPSIPLDALVQDPVAAARAMPAPGAPHEAIALPPDLFAPARRNAAGMDLSDEDVLDALATTLAATAALPWTAGERAGEPRPILDPADHRDQVGQVWDATPAMVPEVIASAAAGSPEWAATPTAARADCLTHAADAFEARMPTLIGLLIREAGKTAPGAISEVREAVDFLRYYAAQAIRTLPGATPLGPIACISPWNFPLAIFTGQVAAALVAGNTVVAKPAEETPLIAAEAVRMLHAAGIPANALLLLPGDGDVGDALVSDPRIQAVVFTGSTAVARSIQARLATRLTAANAPIPLVAETGGQNAMIVDSSALTEQVVADVVASAFNAAGQRCSALRILCLQEEIADRTLAMLEGAMHELEVGPPARLSVDIGPVIGPAAQAAIAEHIEAMRAKGHPIANAPLPESTGHGAFVPPTLIRIARVADVPNEVFGPVLHVLRFPRDRLDALLDEIAATAYGLTFGLHTRLDETVARVLARIPAGNVYINRNVIGAVVGVQPFGGNGLSGTGPKAGGPLYLRRLVTPATLAPVPPAAPGNAPPQPAAEAFATWLDRSGHADHAASCRTMLAQTPLHPEIELPGPVGERNAYRTRPRGRIAALSATQPALLAQLSAILATGNHALVERRHPASATLAVLPDLVACAIALVEDWTQADVRAALFDGPPHALAAACAAAAARPGPIVAIHTAAPGNAYPLEWLVEECSISTNTAAAGGNATLMTIAP